MLQQTFESALQAHQAGQLAKAESLYRQLLQLQPDQPQILHLLGLVAYQRGDFATAVNMMRRAITLKPDEADYHNNLAVALRAAGQTEQAVEAYRQALRLTPHDADVYCNLGSALYALGRMEESASCYREALRIEPGQVQALAGLATVLSDQGKYEEAERYYRGALQLAPQDADLHNGLANLLREQGRIDEAVAEYRAVLRLQPGYPAAGRHLGWLLQESGQTEAALACYREALRHTPDDALIHYNLGNALRELGYLEEAAACYREALRYDPSDADAHNNLGNVLREMGQLQEAIACYRTALALNPDLHHAWGHLLHQSQYACAWHDLGVLAEKVRTLVCDEPQALISPFVLLAAPGTTAAEQRRCAERWASAQYGKYQPRFVTRRSRHSKIRIGYLSADFHEHATAYLMAEVFELHDAQRFEVTAYSYGPDDGSPMRARLKRAFHRFEDIRPLTTEQAAAKIHADGIDILVDLKGYTAHTRTQILALRPAPLQVNYLGYPGTLGAPFVDYLIGDPIVTPPEHAAFYTEKLALLPHAYQPNDRQRPMAEPPSRAACGLPERGVVFCGFNQTFKILPEVFDVWMHLLREVPGSVLWLLQGHPLAEENLRREAEARGVAPERLAFAPRQPLAQHLARQSLADLLLDTLPYNAHTTASDALWCGVPVVTCMGETFAARVAASLLHAVGMPELVTKTLQEYAELALKLAQAPEERQRLRARLLANRTGAPLFDSKRYTQDLETLYTIMWERWLTGLPADMIDLRKNER
ncbi:MAG: tetratricopeptide repeat protein [Methylophilaceae bacterium]|nr:tetratricopeptide repeat protein [Methylophilaceae bacterium]